MEQELRSKLVDDFSHQLLTGALRVARDPSNPIRLSQFAAAMRELFTYTLHTLAPNPNVTQCAWFKQEPSTDGPTRRQRAKYATQGGLSDEYMGKIGVDVKDLHDEAMAAINEMSKFTHVRPDTLIEDQHVIDAFVADAMSALLNLFSSFDDCRMTVIEALTENIDDEAVQALVSETIDDVDILATHHFIEAVEVEEVTITAITDEIVRVKASGSLVVQLQWGSGSDLERGDGATMNESFPFEVSMESPVTDVTALRSVGYAVDTDSWFDQGDGQ